MLHFQKYNNLEEIKTKLTYVTDSIVKCYKGECGIDCRKYSLVCTVQKKKGMWDHCDYLQDARDPLRIDDDNERLFRSIISLRLGRKALENTKFGTNTQKTESIHRTYSMCNPQHVTYSRNFSARIHSSVHLSNHGITTSTLSKLEKVRAPLLPGTCPVRALKQYQEKSNYCKNYLKSPQAKARRASSRKRLYEMHRKKNEEIMYKKDMLEIQKKSVKSDHDYLTRASTSKCMRIGEHTYAKQS